MASTRPVITNANELTAYVHAVGFLPLCPCGIEGFSVKDVTPEGLWFVRDVVGPWEWREDIVDAGEILYAKLFAKKAGFISRAWLPDLANWRRRGLSFAERYEAGLIPRAEKLAMEYLGQQGPSLSGTMRSALGAKGFDTAMTSLQMRTDVLIMRFEHRRDALGRPYGPGATRFALAEMLMDPLLLECRMGDTPETSYARLAKQIRVHFPDATDAQINKVLR